MTVHGVTAEADLVGRRRRLRADKVTGRATTTFPFATFGLTIPKLARLLSVEDKIQLEIDFVLNRTALP